MTGLWNNLTALYERPPPTPLFFSFKATIKSFLVKTSLQHYFPLTQDLYYSHKK